MSNTKKQFIQEEIMLVKHLQTALKNGLLGRSEDEVLGEEPKRRYYSGVLFPAEEFIRQISEDQIRDPQPQYRSLAKNCNLGLEYLVEPVDGKISISVSGSFNLYARVFPSFNEQLQLLEYLKQEERAQMATNNGAALEDEAGADTATPEAQAPEEDTDIVRETKHRGLVMVEKYRKVPVHFSDIEITFRIDDVGVRDIDLASAIDEALMGALNWTDLFQVNDAVIHHTGTVPMEAIQESQEEFLEFINKIRSTRVKFPNWKASLSVEWSPYKSKMGTRLVRVATTLINTTIVPAKDEKPTGHQIEFYDCRFQVEVNHGKHIMYEFDGAARDYRIQKNYAVKGVNCVGEYVPGDNVTLKTETVPDYFQDLYRTREDLSVSFRDLISKQKTIQCLENISQEMHQYLIDWKRYITSRGDSSSPLKSVDEVAACQADMEEFIQEIESFELGIYALKNDDRLMAAFNMMNEVFIRSGEGKYTAWRLFQIVFIVRILPSFYAREMADYDPRIDAVKQCTEIADVLWFPTGGGKTEAYLGLIVTGLFYDRLRGKKIGCSAWIRFPLRMLSKQQLDRLARILIFAEEYRQTAPELLGTGVPFSIGFFAGSGNTENFLSENTRRKFFASDVSKQRAMLLHRCPRCGEKLSLEFDEEAWKFLHVCNNPNCFVNQSSLLKGVVPVYITDSEVYRFVPSVLCGTVDKLAILGRYREFSHIFGQVGGKCPKHGYFSDRCIVGQYDNYNSCDEKALRTKAAKQSVRNHKEAFYDPVPLLLIQDELHLLKEELGALDSHYEGAINEFARAFARKPHHIPKVIAATATIESYQRHIHHLYLRKPRKYPSMGYRAGESFYATSKPQIQRRLYMGVLPHTRAQGEVVTRCLYLYHNEIIRLYVDGSAWTMFQTANLRTREEFIRLLSYYDLSVVYVNQKQMGHDINRRIDESTSQKLSTTSGLSNFELQTEMLTGENDMDKIVAAIDRIESEAQISTYQTKLHTLIATSLISHGVDLERINALFMAGMPSKQAEYIQASSRSSRSHAGLVVVTFRANDLRERSQYQFFAQNHMFMDRLVDPVPINRLATKAIERTIPGLLSGLLLGVHSQNHENTIYSCGEYVKYVANRNAQANGVREEIKEQLKRIIGTSYTEFPLASRQKSAALIDDLVDDLHHLLSTSPSNLKLKNEKVLNPLTSFRDIEEGVPLLPTPETAAILKTSDIN